MKCIVTQELYEEKFNKTAYSLYYTNKKVIYVKKTFYGLNLKKLF